MHSIIIIIILLLLLVLLLLLMLLLLLLLLYLYPNEGILELSCQEQNYDALKYCLSRH